MEILILLGIIIVTTMVLFAWYLHTDECPREKIQYTCHQDYIGGCEMCGRGNDDKPE